MTNHIILRKGTRQRLELSRTDLNVLAFLERHRMLTLQQLYQVTTGLFDVRTKEYSFKNRIRKFEEYHLIRGWQYSEGFEGERFKYLCIGSKGIDLLIEHDFLDQSYNKTGIYKFNQKKNLIHFLATQQAVINIISDLNDKLISDISTKEPKYGILYDAVTFSHSPVDFPYTEWIRKERNLHRQNSGAYHAKTAKYMTGHSSGTELRGSTMTIVKPDWIIELKGYKKTRDAIINIELDMGTEPIETLAQKLFKYAIVAEKNPNVLHIMNIVIADNSFSKRSTLSNGITRANNIINRFREDSAINNRVKESGLIPIVLPLKMNTEKLIYILSKY